MVQLNVECREKFAMRLNWHKIDPSSDIDQPGSVELYAFDKGACHCAIRLRTAIRSAVDEKIARRY